MEAKPRNDVASDDTADQESEANNAPLLVEENDAGKDGVHEALLEVTCRVEAPLKDQGQAKLGNSPQKTGLSQENQGAHPSKVDRGPAKLAKLQAGNTSRQHQQQQQNPVTQAGVTAGQGGAVRVDRGQAKLAKLQAGNGARQHQQAGISETTSRGPAKLKFLPGRPRQNLPPAMWPEDLGDSAAVAEPAESLAHEDFALHQYAAGQRP